jgi:uncharacterized membrane protein YkvA (DUF1232 family)
MLERVKQFTKQIKRELTIYQAVARDSRTPWLPKLLLLVAIGYLVLPFDLIPDWIPVLGMLDDVLIVPGLIFLALKLIPEDIVEEHRKIHDVPV